VYELVKNQICLKISFAVNKIKKIYENTSDTICFLK
jgi:hypothetical protein